MRYLLIAASALAVCGVLASTSAKADMLYYPGGPVKQGNMCQISTDSEKFYGYWSPCPKPAKVAKINKKKMKRS
jgi:hypothetical protein